MRNIFFVLMLFVFFLLQVTVLNYFQSLHVTLDLLFIFVFLASIYLAQTPALILSMASGFLKDMAGIEGFGISILLFPLWSLLIIRLSKKIVLENSFFASIAMGVIAFLHAILVRIMVHFDGSFISWPTFFRISTLESLYAATLLPAVMLLISTLRLTAYPAHTARQEESL